MAYINIYIFMPCIFLFDLGPSPPVQSSPMPFGKSLYFKIVYFHIKTQSLYSHIYAILLYCLSPNHIHSISTNVSYHNSCIFTDHMLNYTSSAVLSFEPILLIYSNSGHFLPCCWVKTPFFSDGPFFPGCSVLHLSYVRSLFKKCPDWNYSGFSPGGMCFQPVLTCSYMS